VKNIRGLGCICGKRKKDEVYVESLVHSEQSQKESLWLFYQHTAVETARRIHYNP